MPARSTKLSEKLVLLPETVEETDEKGEFGEDSEAAPLKDEEQERRPGRERAKSYAERLPKSRRTEKDLARVTAYCTAQAYKMSPTAAFARDRHGARTKLYDDCLYTAYHLPLLPGTNGYRVQCSAPLKGAGGRAVLDEAIEQSEQRDYHGAYFAEDEEQHSVRNAESPHDLAEPEPKTFENHDDEEDRRNSDSSAVVAAAASKPIPVAEMFVFSYGVVVFWNFSEKQEKDVLADLTFSSTLDPKTKTSSPLALATLPLNEEQFETEEFHFEYNNEISRPRVYNDMITLRSGDHMIKLAISHAIAQSTKLSYFEETMATQMGEAKDVPKRLALTGELGMKREDIIKILGGLFKSRVDVNLCKIPPSSSSPSFSNNRLSFSTMKHIHPPYSKYPPQKRPPPSPPLACLVPYSNHQKKPKTLICNPPASNVLDVPNLIWDAEPTLHPLYSAVREYLEIKPRIQVLNERCRVFLDLAEILSDYISDDKMDRLTWIIIVLILLSIAVTCGEVFLRFGLLDARSRKHGGGGVVGGCDNATVGLELCAQFCKGMGVVIS